MLDFESQNQFIAASLFVSSVMLLIVFFKICRSDGDGPDFTGLWVRYMQLWAISLVVLCLSVMFPVPIRITFWIAAGNCALSAFSLVLPVLTRIWAEISFRFAMWQIRRQGNLARRRVMI